MILLLENKEDRQKYIDISAFATIVDNILGDNDCNKSLDKFLEDISIFDKYDTIIIHESIYYKHKRDLLLKEIKDYCKDSNKNLILFSGNNSQSNSSNNILTITAKSLYNYITIFLENY